MYVTELGDDGVELSARGWVENAKYLRIRSDLLEKIKLRFDQEGITISLPQRDVHLDVSGNVEGTSVQKVLGSWKQDLLVSVENGESTKDFSIGEGHFRSYEKLLPGNPNTIFLKADSLVGMGRRRGAAVEYNRHLGIVSLGDQARYAYGRKVPFFPEPPPFSALPH